MSIVNRILGTIFPFYKFRLEREANEALISGIINALPETYHLLKEQKKETKTLSLNDRNDIPKYKFLSQLYPGESHRKYTDKTKNFRLSQIQLYSTLTKRYENVDLLVHDGHISGIKISNSNYDPSEFDLLRINVEGVKEEVFIFPPSDLDLFFQSLDQKDQERIDESGFIDLHLGNRTFYTVFDMKDGNYIAIDKSRKVYSLVHDAIPKAKLLSKSLNEILTDFQNNQFDVSKHLDERY